MLYNLPIAFLITLATASKKAIKNREYGTCKPILENEFEFEKFVFSIYEDTNTVSLKCLTFEVYGSINIPSFAIRYNFSSDATLLSEPQNFTVVKIQFECFRNQTHLKSISIPETITTIEEFAFFDCTSLSSFRFPTNVSTIPQSCFYACVNLESIILPKNLISIEAYSFYRCELLRYFSLPSSVQSIGEHAFSFCRCISNTMDIPHDVSCIESWSFSSCILIETVRVGNIDTISRYAFYNCSSLKRIIIDNDQYEDKDKRSAIQITKIKTLDQNNDFYNKRSDRQVRKSIKHTQNFFNSNNFNQDSNEFKKKAEKFQKNRKRNNSLQSIGEYAFSYTSLSNFGNIFQNLSMIGQNCFMHCTKLEYINLTSKLSSIPSNCFWDCTSLSQIILPSTLKIIENSAFKSCISLVQIEIPDSVTEIGDFAFMQCSRLATLNFPKELLKIGQSSFGLCSNLAIPSVFPPKLKSIGSYAFTYCNVKTEEIKLPSSIEKIGNNPFKTSFIEGIDMSINNTFFISYQNVLYSAFYTEEQVKNSEKNKNNVQKDHEPKSIEEAFEIAYPGIPFSSINKKTISFATYSECEKVEILEGTIKIGIDTFSDSVSLKEIIFPSTINSIDAGAFSNSLSLNNISLPPKLTMIGGEAFKNCLKLKGIMYIPSLVTSIGSLAFSCTGIEAFEVSEDNHFFFSQSGCLYNFPRTTLIQYPNGNTNRTSFEIPQYTETIGHSCFLQNRYLEEVIFSSSLIKVEDKAFSMCSLQIIKLNENLNSIGRLSFSQITLLVSIQFPKSLQLIEDGAFSNTPLEYIEFASCSVTMSNNVFDLSQLVCVIFPSECNGSKIWNYFPPDKINNPDCFITLTPSISPTYDDHSFKFPFSITVLVLIISAVVFIVTIICISFFAYRNKKKKEKMMKNPNIIESWIIGDPNSTSINYYTQNKK